MAGAAGLTRGRVRATATRLFRERGYAATSMRDIAEALGVRKASLYHHVARKEDLLLETALDAGRLLLEAQARIRDDATLGPAERLRRMLAAHVRVVTDHQALVHTLLRERRALGGEARERLDEVRRAYERAWLEALHAAAAAGEIRPPVPDLKLAMLGILGMADWVVEWYRPDGPLGPDAVAAGIADLAMTGLGLGAPSG
jgi:AcrR family transcriptional regulator